MHSLHRAHRRIPRAPRGQAAHPWLPHEQERSSVRDRGRGRKRQERADGAVRRRRSRRASRRRDRPALCRRDRILVGSTLAARRMRDEIAGAFDAPIQPPAHDVETAIPRWIEALRTGQEQRPLVIFLDAVDQVENRDGVDLLDWLPRHLPAQTKLVASLAEPDESTSPGHDRQAGSTRLRLSGLSWPEARHALRAWMRSAKRTIQPAQERAIQARFARCPLPLFLKLAFERARGWTSGDRRVGVADGLDGIVDAALDEFELRHGRELVSHALRYLRTARFGLAEDEMVSVLGQQREVLLELRRRSPQSPRADELPVAVWARLYADLAPYLAQRSGAGVSLLGFYHRVVGGRAAQRYGRRAMPGQRIESWRRSSAAGPCCEQRSQPGKPPIRGPPPRCRTTSRVRGCGKSWARRSAICSSPARSAWPAWFTIWSTTTKPRLGPAQKARWRRRSSSSSPSCGATLTPSDAMGMPAFVEQQAHNFRRDGPVRHASAKRTGDRAAAPWFKRLNLPGSNPVLQAKTDASHRIGARLRIHAGRASSPQLR